MKKRRILSILLALAMVLTFMPTMAFANTDPVAKIDDTTYATLGAAISEANDNDTIQLIADVNTAVTISKKTLTLDMNGFNIKSQGCPIKVVDGANLTIVNTNTTHNENTVDHNAILDTNENGLGSLAAHGAGVKVLIKAGYYYGFTGNKTAINAYDGAEITFEDCFVNGASGTSFWDDTTGKEGKVFYSGRQHPDSSQGYAPGHIIVKGGFFRGRMSESDWGQYTIMGGTFYKDEVQHYVNPEDKDGNPKGTSAGTNTTISLSETGWVPDEYAVVNNEDGSFSVVGIDKVAASVKKDGKTTNYTDLSQALAAADELATLTIRKAVEGESISTDKNINVRNESGQTISVNGNAVGTGKSINTNEATAKKSKDNAENETKTVKDEAAKREAAMAVRTITVNTATVTAATVDKAVIKAGGSKEYVTTVVLGKKVKKVKKGAFKNYKKANILVIKTKKLKKSSVKKSLAGSTFTKIRISIGNNKTNLNYLNKYKKFFTKKNAGKKVKLYYNALY